MASFLRILRTLLWLTGGLFLIVLAVNNRGAVDVTLWPLTGSYTLPLWSIFFLGIFLGLLLAGSVLSALRLQGFAKRRQAERKAADLEKQVDAMAEDAHAAKAERAHAAITEQ